jgi:protein TonB
MPQIETTSMPDRYIEKSFLIVLFVSLILHLGCLRHSIIFRGIASTSQRAGFIDLQQMPEPKQPLEQRQQETKRRSEQRIRVPRSAPHGDVHKTSEMR